MRGSKKHQQVTIVIYFTNYLTKKDIIIIKL